MRSRCLPLCLCALLLVAAGCHRQQRQEPRQGGAAPTAAGPAPPARAARPTRNLACDLLTKDDAEALFGEPVQGEPVTSAMADIGVVSWRCGYISARSSSGPASSTKVVTLLVKHWQERAEARSAYEHAHALSQSISGQVPEPVDGLGERAYWAGGKVNQLNVLAGNDWLVISGTEGPGLDQLGPAKAAAARILAHH
ncbi:MAG TPA: hypothetical protein VMW75_13090 [Thermoanaerobaculia bacterium]|nr:hypothetical protein [Thermoanaerobaculia bacterium]